MDPRIYQRAFGAYPSHTQKDQFDDEMNCAPDELEQEVLNREHDEWEALADFE